MTYIEPVIHFFAVLFFVHSYAKSYHSSQISTISKKYLSELTNFLSFCCNLYNESISIPE